MTHLTGDARKRQNEAVSPAPIALAPSTSCDATWEYDVDFVVMCDGNHDLDSQLHSASIDGNGSVPARVVWSTRPGLFIPGLCHWIQNRDGVQARETHQDFHFGSPCPYMVVDHVLRGQSDPRNGVDQ